MTAHRCRYGTLRCGEISGNIPRCIHSDGTGGSPVRPIRLSILGASMSLTGALVYLAGQFKDQRSGEELMGAVLIILGVLLGVVAAFARDEG